MVNDLLYKEILERMKDYKHEINYETLGTEILLLSLIEIDDSMTSLILKELNVKKEGILSIIKEFCFIREEKLYTNTLTKVFERAKELEKNKEYVYDEAYLFALLEQENSVAMHILSILKIEGNTISEELENALSYLEEDDKLLVNYTIKAKNKELNKLVGRKDIINTLDMVLSKKQKNNCMLVGPAGVGKSGIVEGLAYYYLKHRKDYTIYNLDIGRLISGTRYRGDLEEKLMDVLDSIKDGNNIVFIDEIHNIISNNSENTIDIANLLKPFLARSSIKCIGATTIDEYYKTIAKDKALARRFKLIYVKEPTIYETVKILNGIKEDYENYHKVKYSDDVIKRIVLGSKYIINNNNPDKSIDIMDECGVYSKGKNKKINSYMIKELIFNNLGINFKKGISSLYSSPLNEEIKENIKQYFNLKKNKYIYCGNIKENDKKKTIQEFKKIFNLNEDNILEIDMDDYSLEHSISTLLGTSPGYVGYEEGGILSKQILRHNVNIIIIKNYDKKQIIYKKIFDRIINTGVIIDYQGKTLKFINCIILLMKKEDKKIGF